MSLELEEIDIRLPHALYGPRRVEMLHKALERVRTWVGGGWEARKSRLRGNVGPAEMCDKRGVCEHSREVAEHLRELLLHSFVEEL